MSYFIFILVNAVTGVAIGAADLGLLWNLLSAGFWTALWYSAGFFE